MVWPFAIHVPDEVCRGCDPDDASDMVVPSLPDFGLSDHATERGMDVQGVAGMVE